MPNACTCSPQLRFMLCQQKMTAEQAKIIFSKTGFVIKPTLLTKEYLRNCFEHATRTHCTGTTPVFSLYRQTHRNHKSYYLRGITSGATLKVIVHSF